MTMINLKYRIPLTLGTTAEAQFATFSSLELDQGELQKLKLMVVPGSDIVTAFPTFLERNLTLTEEVPAFVDACGPSNPATWGLQNLFGERIQRALNTTLVPN